MILASFWLRFFSQRREFTLLYLRESQTAEGIAYNHDEQINEKTHGQLDHSREDTIKAFASNPHPEVAEIGNTVLEATHDEEHDWKYDHDGLLCLAPPVYGQIHHGSAAP